MKKFYTSLMIVLLTCTLFLTSCKKDDKGLLDNPSTNATVISNGGQNVVKGDYMYYVNGYVENYSEVLDDYKSDNVFGEVEYGAIYRTKLSKTGNLEKTEDGFLVKTEIVVPHVVGFENGAFYIVDDFIYYSTPLMEKDKQGKLQNTWVAIYRININGTGLERVFVSSESIAPTNWNVYKTDGKHYLVVNELSALKVYRVDDKVNKIAEISDVTSYAYNSNNFLNENNSFVYFTRAINDDDNLPGYTGNVIAKMNIKTGKVETLVKSNDNTYKIIKMTDTNVYYTIEKKNLTTCLYTSDFYNFNINTKLTDKDYTDYYVSSFNSKVIIAIDSEGIDVINKNVIVEHYQQSDVKVYGYFGNSLVVSVDNKLSIYNTDSFEMTTLKNENDKEFLTDFAQLVDVSERRIAVYTKYTADDDDNSEHYYMNVMDLFDKDSNPTFVGKFMDGHTPVKPDEDSTDKWID